MTNLPVNDKYMSVTPSAWEAEPGGSGVQGQLSYIASLRSLRLPQATSLNKTKTSQMWYSGAKELRKKR